MQLINRPADFDVVVTENMFGDILSDEAAQITGSLGMLASASLGDSHRAVRAHPRQRARTSPARASRNPLAQILSVEMMLRYSFGMNDAADDIRRAVHRRVLDDGWRTGDLKDAATPADKVVRLRRHGRSGGFASVSADRRGSSAATGSRGRGAAPCGKLFVRIGAMPRTPSTKGTSNGR